jgi:hypothetical protein
MAKEYEWQALWEFQDLSRDQCRLMFEISHWWVREPVFSPGVLDRKGLDVGWYALRPPVEIARRASRVREANQSPLAAG